MNDHVRQLTQNQLFADVPPAQLQRLQRATRAERIGKGSPIYLPADAADAVFLLSSGRIRICHLTHDGKRSTLAFVEPPEVFGELAVIDSSPREEYAEATKQSVVVRIPAGLLREIVQEVPRFCVRLMQLIGLRRKRAERRLRNLLFSSSRDRLVHLLLELADKYGVSTEGGLRLTTDLSHQDLASMIGSTRETVTLVLGDLQTEGLIKLGRRKITLIRPAAFNGLVRRLAGASLPSVFGEASLVESPTA